MCMRVAYDDGSFRYWIQKKNQMQISRKKLRSKRLLVGSFGSSEVHAQKTLLAPEHLQKLGPNRQIWKV